MRWLLERSRGVGALLAREGDKRKGGEGNNRQLLGRRCHRQQQQQAATPTPPGLLASRQPPLTPPPFSLPLVPRVPACRLTDKPKVLPTSPSAFSRYLRDDRLLATAARAEWLLQPLELNHIRAKVRETGGGELRLLASERGGELRLLAGEGEERGSCGC